MAGYIGYSRSVNSQLAIDEGLVSLNMINRYRINNLIGEYPEKVIKMPVTVWKDVIRNDDVEPQEWHHTGKKYRRTYYYDLNDVAIYLSSHYKAVLKQYRQKKHNRHTRKKYQHQHYVVCKTKDWSNSGKTIFFDYDEGKLKETPNTLWLVMDDGRKDNLNANRVVDYWIFKSKKTYSKFLHNNEDKLTFSEVRLGW